MKKVKITVLRCTFNEDMAKEYAEPGLKPCSVLKEGQVFYAGLGKPEGFCDGAGAPFTHTYSPLQMGLSVSISTIGFATTAWL